MTTEEQIARIAQGFGQGVQNFQQGQNQQRQRSIQDEARRRQEALQAIDVANTMGAQQGRVIDPSAIQPLLSSGNLQGIGDLLASAPVSDKFKAEQERLGREQQLKDLQMQKLQGDISQSALPFEQTREGQKAAFVAGLTKPKNIARDEIDKQFAKEFTRYKTGGAAKQFENLRNLETALGTLTSTPGITGPIKGSIPDFVRNITSPEAVATRQQVEGAIQGSLRETLGAQFTEKEGERIMKNAFNPSLPQEENIRRVSVIAAGLKAATQAKEDQFKYLERTGSMAGYDGPDPKDVFDGAMSEMEKKNSSQSFDMTGGAIPTAQASSPEQIQQQIKSMTREQKLQLLMSGDR